MMHKNRLTLPVLAVLALTTACASTHERAQKSLDEGSYEKAAALYERLLKKNQNDPQAIEGLARARSGIIGKQLINVRKARMAGNQGQATELLLDVIDQEKKWNFFPGAQVGFTQQEESDYAVPYAKNTIHGALKEEKPLFAAHQHQRYAPLFESKKAAPLHQSLQAAITAQGKASCKQFMEHADATVPYFTDFVVKYCGYWGMVQKAPAQSEEKRLAELHGSLDVQDPENRFSPEARSLIAADLRTAFEETAWFDPKGTKPASIRLSGSYQERHDKNLVNLFHQYMVDEPYQTVEEVEKTRQIPYQVVTTSYGPNGEPMPTEVTRYREERYKEKEAVTRYRKVQKIYPYNALRHTQALEFVAHGEVDLGGHHLAVQHSDKSNAEGVEHDLDLKDIGLKPSRPSLINAAQWRKMQSEKLADKLRKEASAQWSRLYCQSAAEGKDLARAGNQVHKCLRAKLDVTPALAQEWYKQHLGLSFREANALLAGKN